MILTVSFHFREPFIPNIIILISLILFLVGSLYVKKDDSLKRANLLVIGSAIAILWYIVDFFIPGILLPLTPTPEDIEFTRIYGMIFAGLIPASVLILSLGIMPIAVYFMNRTAKSVIVLALGAVIQIVSVVIGFGQYGSMLSVFSLILTAISIAFFTYYGYQVKNLLFIVFAISFFIARALYFIMI
ncbi:MAG: hypothetical protein ACFFD7_15615 [Candidatus Thorarchaeota archaeon]